MKKLFTFVFILVCASVYAATIADQLTALNGIKQDIKDAIEAKGQTVTEVFSSYATAIEAITSGEATETRTCKTDQVLEVGDPVYIKNIAATCPTVGNSPDTMPSASWASNPGGHIQQVALSGDGNFFVMWDWIASPTYLYTYKWNVDNERYEKTDSPDTNTPNCQIKEVALSDDGSILAVCGGRRTDSWSEQFVYTYKWNETNNRYEKTSDIYPERSNTTESHSVALTGDGHRLIIGGATSGVYTKSYEWNEENNRFEAGNAFSKDLWIQLHYSNYDYDYCTGRVRVSKDGNILVGCNNFYVEYYKWSEENKRYESQGYAENTYKARFLALSGDGLTMAIHSGTDLSTSVVIYKLNTETNTWAKNTMPYPYPYIFRDDVDYGGITYARGDTCLALNYNGTVLLSKYSRLNNPRFLMYKLDSETGQYISKYAPSYDVGGFVKSLAISNDGYTMVACSNKKSHTFHHYVNEITYEQKAYKITGVDPFPLDIVGIGYVTKYNAASQTVNVDLSTNLTLNMILNYE